MKDANSCDFSIDNVVITYQSDQVSTVCSGGNDSYMFGFNGQMKDNEVYGDGNAYSFEYRIHDPRLGRFLSVDPLFKEYPWNSTYSFAENSPIAFLDLEGAERFHYILTLDANGRAQVALMQVEDIIETSYSYAPQDCWICFNSETKVNPRQEYVVHLYLNNVPFEYNNTIYYPDYDLTINALSPDLAYDVTVEDFQGRFNEIDLSIGVAAGLDGGVTMGGANKSYENYIGNNPNLAVDVIDGQTVDPSGLEQGGGSSPIKEISNQSTEYKFNKVIEMSGKTVIPEVSVGHGISVPSTKGYINRLNTATNKASDKTASSASNALEKRKKL